MLASTAAKVAAVAAQFPTVCEDYIQALWDFAIVRPIDFRVQIAMEEGFFQAIQYILDTRGLQDVQLTVGQWIATLFELQYGQYTEIEIVPDDQLQSGELPPRQALHGTSAVAAIEIIRAGFQGNVCNERKSDITGRVEKMAYVAYDEDNTSWGYAGNRDANYSPDARATCQGVHTSAMPRRSTTCDIHETQQEVWSRTVAYRARTGRD